MRVHRWGAVGVAVGLAVLMVVPPASATPDSSPTPTPSPTLSAPESPSPAPLSPAPAQPSPTDSARPEPRPTPEPTRPEPSATAEPPSPANAVPGDRAPRPRVTSDAVQPVNPAIADELWQLWRRMQDTAEPVANAQTRLDDAEAVLTRAQAQDMIAQARLEQSLEHEAAAQAVHDAAVRSLYMAGPAGIADSMEAVLLTTDSDSFESASHDEYLHASFGTHAASELVAAQAATQSDRARAAQTAADRAAAERNVSVAAAEVTRARAARQAAITAYTKAQRTLMRPTIVLAADGCPKQVPEGTLRGGAEAIPVRRLCTAAVEKAATPQAALALRYAFAALGAPYACDGVGRLLPYRFDCSSLVARAYAEGAGLDTAGEGWAPSTRDMVPWDGVALGEPYRPIPVGQMHPGDLVLFDTCMSGSCPYRHVVMYLGEVGGQEWMLHTNACGDVAKVEPLWPLEGGSYPLLGVRRVVADRAGGGS